MITQDLETTEQVKHLVHLFNKAKSIRTNWTSYWEELARYVQPTKNNPYGFRAKGQKMGDELLDSTGIHCNELLASALHSILTHPLDVWFGMTTGDDKLDSDDAVRSWLSAVVRVMINVLNNSNFQPEIHEYYLDQGSFGTSHIMCEEDDIDIVRFHTRSLFELFALENSKGVIDTVFREFKMNMHQLKDKFGEEWMDDECKHECHQDPFTKEYTIIHVIIPREGHSKHMAKLPKQYAMGSYYILVDKLIMLEESGYQELPFAMGRWTKIAGEIYGRSPAMKALPEIKMINKMMEVTIKAAQLQIAPPIAVPDDGYILPVKMQPFGITYYRSGTQDDIKPLFQNLRLDLSKEILFNTREKIQQAFFVDQFQLRQGPQMTATEVNQHIEEQTRTLSPIMGRQNNEGLRPLMNRVFAICQRRGLFPKMPIKLSKKKVDFFYVSQIAKVQKTSEVNSITRMVNSVAPFIQNNPESLDMFDSDKIVKYAAKSFMIPAELIRDEIEVKKLREARQAALQKKAQDQENMNNAEMANKVAPMMQQMGSDNGSMG